jgi:hypothetical protein
VRTASATARSAKATVAHACKKTSLLSSRFGTILDPRYRFGVFDNLQWNFAEKENAFECFAQQFQLYQERYTEEIAASTAASTEVEAQSEQHPQATGKQSAPKRRKITHPKDEADVALLSTGLFYVEEEDAAPDAEIAAYQEERRLTAQANPLDFWRCNSSRYPVLPRMVHRLYSSGPFCLSFTVALVLGPRFLADPGHKCASGGCLFVRFSDHYKARQSTLW